ncbi:MAG TPA: YciI family protein, partial [Acidimicrobiia bacterium]|nr:YciI family protein [Acidimicrobiia bacterium]
MRFMMFMLPNIDPADWMPSDAEAVAEMTRYNQSLQQAGVLLALDGLHSQSEGIRVEFASGKRTVTDGPFTEAKEMIGGYWIIDVKSKEEAVEWASRCPGDNCTIEVRQIFELAEFPPDVQEA